MQELAYPFDAEFINKKYRSLKKQLRADGCERVKKRVAILGGFTTSYVKQSLELFLLNYGIEPVFYESEFGKFYEDAVFSNPALDEFNPDFIYICTSNRNITAFPEPSDSKDTSERLLDAEFQRFEYSWNTLKTRFNVPVLQNNFEKPLLRLLGNNDACDFRGHCSFINSLNQRIAEAVASRDDLYLIDFDYIASDYGLREFSDPFYWYLCKSAIALNATPYVAFNVANVIKAILGKNKKGLVLDLDNTLWGGVIADDGLQGIKIGQESSEDQAYSAFQRYLKDLSETGVVLTVSSKNDEEQAFLGLNHPEGVLRPDDFAVIKANWDRKSQSIKAIANELNLLAESLVFIDDNPAERLEVQSSLAEVCAPLMNEVAHRAEIIDRSGFFENIKLSSDDLKRNEMYKENARRKELQIQFDDYGEYLDSLQMCSVIKAFEPVYYQRIAQLCNKSNQFNLTTRRYSVQDIEKLATDDHFITFYCQLKDRFGDNGVVSLFVGEIEGDTLHIRLWLMSCRVLKRDLEKALADAVIKKAQSLGLKKIVGYYYPTAKNAMVKNFYEDLGFEKVKDTEIETVWYLSLVKNDNSITFSVLNHHIKVLMD